MDTQNTNLDVQRQELYNYMANSYAPSSPPCSLEDLTATDLWQWSVEKNKPSSETSFKYDPPVKATNRSNRVLIIGTSYEVAQLEKNLTIFDGEAVFESQTRNFWQRFFGSDDYMNSQAALTLPKRIVTTGHMRNSDAFDTYTVNASNRLNEIAAKWNIPIEYIPSLRQV
jgi:hypothetical protein